MRKEQLHPKREFTDVRALIEWAGEEYGERYAYSYRKNAHDEEIERITFAQLRDDVRALASSLMKMGCAHRHCVIVGKFSYEWVLTYFSVLSIGGVLVPLDPEWQPADLADTAKNAGAEFLFIEDTLGAKSGAIVEHCDLLHAPVMLGASAEREDGLLALVEAGRELFAAGPDSYFGEEIDPFVMALLVFTSGTTGKGKGVMLSQSAVLSDLCDVIPYVDFGIKTVGVLPPHHTYGSSVMMIGHAIIGAEIYISSGLRYVQRELKEQKPEHMVLVPLYLETFYRKILATVKDQGKEALLYKMIALSNSLRKIGIDLRAKMFSSVREAFGGKIRMIISGGASINPDILNFFESIGISTLNGYGITECAPIIAVNRTRHVVPGSVGTVLNIDTVRIDDPNEDGEGEICVKGPNVMLGYYRDEAATAAAIDEEGFFHTGDYGKLDKNNILYITGRKKNLIILSNGKNVYPEEIENELIATPGILDIVVYEGQSKRGVSHNAIVAEVYPDKDYIEKNNIVDIKEHLKPYIDEYNKNAVPYKKIRIFKVRSKEFPKNTLRKIQRFQIDTTID